MSTQNIQENIREDMKQAMRAHEKERLSTIRLIISAIKQREIDERITLNNEQTLAVLDKMIKQRRESIAQYQTANRQDLVDKEAEEVRIIQTYLPPQLSEAEIDQFIATAIKETGATSARDMGKLMSALKPHVQGRADMAIVSAKVKKQLLPQ